MMPPHKYTPPVARALSPREPASAPIMARKRSTASTARGSLPSKAAFVMAGASYNFHRLLLDISRDIQLAWSDTCMGWHWKAWQQT